MKIRLIVALGFLLHMNAVQTVNLPAGWGHDLSSIFDAYDADDYADPLGKSDREAQADNYRKVVIVAAIVLLQPGEYVIAKPVSETKVELNARTERTFNVHSFRMQGAMQKVRSMPNNKLANIDLASKLVEDAKVLTGHKFRFKTLASVWSNNPSFLNSRKHRPQQPNNQSRPSRAPVIKHSGSKGRTNPYVNLLTERSRK